MKQTSVLFVCLGNICRSPVAEAITRAKAKEMTNNTLLFDSAGTAGWHVGKAPDPRMIEAASTRGYDLSYLRARQVKPEDFHKFDYILAMDNENLADLEDVAPLESQARLHLFLDYAENLTINEVPDPYYGGEDGFLHVIDLVENAALGFLKALDQDASSG